MLSVRLLALLSTVLLVVGALLVGEALHAGVVTGTYAATSPYVVLRIVLGCVFIALGYRFRTPTEEYVAMPSGEPNRSDRGGDESPGADPSDPEATGDFDASVSPLGEEGLEHVDAEEADRSDRSDE